MLRKVSAIFYVTWPSALLFVCLLTLLCHLGQWQWHRYQDKTQWLQTYHHTQQSTPIPFDPATLPKTFSHLALTGHYLNQHTVYLENQRNDKGIPGFHVLTPLALPHTPLRILVDRGWVPAIHNSNTPPRIPPITHLEHLTGMLVQPNMRGFMLGHNIPEPNKRPLMIQKIDLSDIASALHQPFFPFVIQLDPASPDGYARQWTLPSLPPQRHFGYMIQWYAMAVTLCILYLYWGFSHAKKQPKNSTPV